MYKVLYVCKYSDKMKMYSFEESCLFLGLNVSYFVLILFYIIFFFYGLVSLFEIYCVVL